MWRRTNWRRRQRWQNTEAIQPPRAQPPCERMDKAAAELKTHLGLTVHETGDSFDIEIDPTHPLHARTPTKILNNGVRVLAKPDGDAFHYVNRTQAQNKAATVEGAKVAQFGRVFYVAFAADLAGPPSASKIGLLPGKR
jgi:hypothetical protein